MLPDHKTKIVATIGPASESPGMLEKLVRAGMSIARLNFSHGDFAEHGLRIERLREAARSAGRRVAILADLPGPKMRVGKIEPGPITLAAGERFVLTAEEIVGGPGRVSVTFQRLPEVVKPGDRLFLNDGLILLVVEGVQGADVVTRVDVGGELSSKKGLNLPGIDLGASAFTEHDRVCLEFALENGVDAVSQSFVETPEDVQAVREAARRLGRSPFVVAKIERAGALRHLDGILDAADGIMVARGDLGVEVALAEIALTQKDLIARANAAGKPVITATQMLESMVENRLPTRAEATDVANAVLDGTDALMLSAESATGRHPEESVQMLASIAAVVEARRPHVSRPREALRDAARRRSEAIASIVERALESVPCGAVFAPTRSGTTARMISRVKPLPWIIAIAGTPETAQGLVFSYGVHAIELPSEPASWRAFAVGFMRENRLAGDLAVLVAGPSEQNPEANTRVEFLRVG